MTGRDASEWSNIGILYNDIFYDTVEEFRAAWEQADFVKLTKARDGPFGWTSRQGNELPYDTLPAPNDVSPVKRYAVDEDNKYVKWMDFGFYLAFDRDVGLKFYDVKYKEERIIFELGKKSSPYLHARRKLTHGKKPCKKLLRITRAMTPSNPTPPTLTHTMASALQPALLFPDGIALRSPHTSTL